MRRNGDGGALSRLSEISADDLVRAALGRVPTLAGAALSPALVALAQEEIQAERRHRRRLAATGLGGWYIPPPPPGGRSWVEQPFSYQRDKLADVSSRLRDMLKRVPGAPFSIRKEIGPSPEYPEMIRATSSVVSSTGQTVARAHFDAIEAGQQGPIGFAADRAQIQVLSAQGEPEMERDTGVLRWSLTDRLAGRPPILADNGEDQRLPDTARVRITGPVEHAALIMAMVMAANSAYACMRDGWAAACFNGQAVEGVWPPKARAKTGIYSTDEARIALASAGHTAEVRATLADNGIPRDVYEDWARDQDWITTFEKYTPADFARLLRDDGGDTGHVRIGPAASMSTARPWLAEVRAFLRQKRADAAITAAPTVEAAVAAYRQAQTEPPTALDLNKSALAARLAQGGYDTHYRLAREYGYNRAYYDAALDGLIKGEVTFADLDRRAKEAQEKKEEDRLKHAQSQLDALGAFSEAMNGASPGVYTHKPTRSRYLSERQVSLTLTPRHGAWTVQIRVLRGDPREGAYITVDVPLGDSDEAEVIHRLHEGARLASRAARVEQAKRAVQRLDTGAIDDILHDFQGYMIRGDGSTFSRVEDVWPWLHTLDRARVLKAAPLPPRLLELLRAPGSPTGWRRDGPEYRKDGEQIQPYKVALVMAYHWLTETLMKQHGLQRRDIPPAAALFLDWYEGRPFGTTSPDDPAILRWMRQITDLLPMLWATRGGIFEGQPQPWVWGPQPAAATPRVATPTQPVPAPAPPAPPPAARPAPVVVEPPPLAEAPQSRPEAPVEPAPLASRPVPADFAVRGWRAARAERASAAEWPASGKPAVVALRAAAPTPADLTPAVLARVWAGLSGKERGSLRVYLTELAALGRLDPALVPA